MKNFSPTVTYFPYLQVDRECLNKYFNIMHLQHFIQLQLRCTAFLEVMTTAILNTFSQEFAKKDPYHAHTFTRYLNLI